jgi:3-methyladenine DNA glycosylase AlkD
MILARRIPSSNNCLNVVFRSRVVAPGSTAPPTAPPAGKGRDSAPYTLPMVPRISLPADAALPGVAAADLAREILTGLRAAGDPARAAPMAAYMRDRFAFLGVATPLRRAATRAPIAAARATRDGDLALAVAAALWREPWRECHYAGVDLLAVCATVLRPAALPHLKKLIVTHSWWDTIDGLAKHVVGAIVMRHRGAATTMDRWAVAPNPWLRRTAILHQLGYKEATDGDRLFRHCLANAGDPDFFLRKGIGWALRQYAYVEPKGVAAFLDAHADLLSPLSRREAAKHLSPPPRDRPAPPGCASSGAPSHR